MVITSQTSTAPALHDDELDAFRLGNADLEQPAGSIRTYQHRELIDVKHSDRIAVGVKHVVIRDPVPARTRKDHRVHVVNLP